MPLDTDTFFEELDLFRKTLRKNKDYDYFAGVDFYIGRTTWNIRVRGILSVSMAARIRDRAQQVFPDKTVSAYLTDWGFYTVRIYMR